MLSNTQLVFNYLSNAKLILRKSLVSLLDCSTIKESCERQNQRFSLNEARDS